MPSPIDLLVAGAGPAGLAAGIAASRAGLGCVILDKGGIASSISRFQRDMPFFSTPELLEIGGVPFVVPGARPTSLECVKYYRAVADRFALDCRTGIAVEGVERGREGFTVRISGGGALSARAVVIATGYYDTPKKLGVPGEELPHVSSWYRDPLPHHRRRVVVVGGKNSAVEAALDLRRHGAEVTVVHRGPALSPGVKYWMLPDFENRVAEGAIRFLPGTTVVEFREGRTIVRDPAGAIRELPADAVFTLIGYEADTAFLRSCGIAVDEATGGPVHDPGTMETNVPGLFVAGGLVGGRFNNKIFIENGREHGGLIVAELLRRQGRIRAG